MKTIILVFLLSVMAFGQSGKSVLTQAQKDSILSMMQDSLGYVTPSVYGAVADGSTNDASAFQGMFNDSPSKISLNTNSIYNIDTYQISYNNADNVVIDGNNATLDMNSYFITITSGDSWIDAAHTGWSDATLQSKAIANTLFTTDFIVDSSWVGITDSSDWDCQEGDMLFITDSSEVGYNAIGGCFVIDRKTPNALYFTKPIQSPIDVSDIRELRFVKCSGKNIIIRNLDIKNGGLRVSGFENVWIENCTAEMDSTTWQALNTSLNGNTNALEGFTAIWNRNVWITNSQAKGYLLAGYGYGVDVGMGDNVIVNGLIGSDCRHILTTTSTSSGAVYLNNLEIINSKATYSKRAGEIIVSNKTGFDTHPGVRNTHILNCEQNGGDRFADHRGLNIKIEGSKSTNTDVFLFSQIPTNANRSIILNNNESYNVKSVLYFNYDNLDYVGINNQTVTVKNMNESVPNSIIYTTTLSNIDTLKISGGYFYGSDASSSFYQTSTSDTGTYRVNNILVDGVLFDNFTTIFSVDTCNIRNLYFNNNKVFNTTYLIQNVSVDSGTANKYGRWVFQNNIFKGITNIHSNAPYYNRIGNWEFLSNSFDSCGNIFAYPTCNIDTIIIHGNTFKDVSGMLVRLEGDYSGFIEFSNNQVNCGVNILDIARIGGNNAGYFLDNSFTHYAPTADRLLISGDGTIKFINNYFQIDSSRYNYLMETTSGANVTFIRNNFEVSGTKYLFQTVDSTLNLKDNEINFDLVYKGLDLNAVATDSTLIQVGEVYNGVGTLKVKFPQNIYTSDFSSNADGWVVVTVGTLDGNIDGIDGEDDCLRLTVASGLNNINHTTIPTNAGMGYDITLDYYVPSASASLTTLIVFNTEATTQYYRIDQVTFDSWQTITIPGITATGNGLRIGIYPFGPTPGELIYFKNIRVDLQ